MTLICKVMRVSRSGYYAWRERSLTGQMKENEKIIPLVRQIYRESGGTYGTRRMAQAIKADGISCGRARARTLMNLAGVAVRQRKRFRVTTDSKHNLPVAPNRLERQFAVAEPNRVWVSDITYIWTVQGWLYLAVVMDLFSRQVVGWAIDRRISKKLAIDTLRMAIWRRQPPPGLVFHSDRGSQYSSSAFQGLLKTHKMISSMSRKGDCWDNAVVWKAFLVI